MGNNLASAPVGTSKASGFSAPLLLLDDSCWSFVAPFLDYNDLIRLIKVGSHALAARVRRVHCIRLKWATGRYVDFAEVARTANQFSSLYEVDFCTDRLHWPTAHSQMLPSSLIALKLNFSDAIPSLLGQPNLKATLPSLEILNLSQASNDKLIEAPFMHQVDFRGLPPFLRDLTLQARSQILYMDAGQLQHLPSTLQALILLFEPIVVPSSQFDSNPDAFDCYAKVTLQLPDLDNLATLAIASSNITAWHVDCALLPSSLTKFKYRALQGSHSTTSDSPGCTIDITDLPLRLRRLNVLNLRHFAIPLETLVQQVPSSVTYLKVSVIDEPPNATVSSLEFLAKRLTSIEDHKTPQLEEYILSGENAVPHLTSLNLRPVKRPNFLVQVPNSVRKITQLLTTIESVPSNLEELSIDWTYIARNNFAPFGNRLKKLKMYTNILDTHLEFDSMPDTLESLDYGFSALSWFKFINRMLKPHRLQNLSTLVSTFYLSPLCLQEIPSQLTSLTFKAMPDALLAPEKLVGLRTSSLTALHITIRASNADLHLAATLQILNHLPPTLRSLHLASPCLISSKWQLKLPEKLSRFEFMRYMDASVPTMPIVPSDHLPVAFVLPPSVTHLMISMAPSPWQWQELPPYLSFFDCDSSLDVRAAYFANRKPPTS